MWLVVIILTLIAVGMLIWLFDSFKNPGGRERLTLVPVAKRPRKLARHASVWNKRAKLDCREAAKATSPRLDRLATP